MFITHILHTITMQKNKLVKYVKDVYVPNTNTIMGYDEYDGNGKLVRSVRW